jgi:hypothetical protein
MLGDKEEDFFNLFIAFEWMRREFAIIISIEDSKI